jgi:hypothetical protein
MDWETLLIGLACLYGSIMLFLMRHLFNYGTREPLKPITRKEMVSTWIWIIITASLGIWLVIQSFIH